MKKYYLLLAIALTLSASCVNDGECPGIVICPGDLTINDVEYLGYRGQIKTIKKESFYDPLCEYTDGKLVMLSNTTNCRSRVEYEFDNGGVLTKQTFTLFYSNIFKPYQITESEKIAVDNRLRPLEWLHKDTRIYDGITDDVITYMRDEYAYDGANKKVTVTVYEGPDPENLTLKYKSVHSQDKYGRADYDDFETYWAGSRADGLEFSNAFRTERDQYGNPLKQYNVSKSLTVSGSVAVWTYTYH